MNEHFLILGSNSFSGSTFAAYLLQQGYNVTGVSRSIEPSDVFLPYKWTDHHLFKFHQLDLNHDLSAIIELIQSTKPKYIVNFAAQSMVAQSWEHPAQWYSTNTLSTAKFIDHLNRVDFLKKFVQISTPEVYGSTTGTVTEGAPYNPSTPYAVSKAACDMNLMAYVKAYGFPAAFTRAANVCGPGQQLYRIIPRTILSVLSNNKLKLQGGGHSTRCFIHMRDVSSATLAVSLDAPIGSIYHLSCENRVSIRELVHTICKAMNVSFNDYVEETEGRRGHDDAYLLDYSKAQSELGWTPRISLNTIIQETVDWMKNNWNIIKELPCDYIHKP